MALMNGCVCVTDESSYLDTHFIDGEHLYLYSLEEMDDMAELVRNILQNPSSAAATAAKGYAHAVRHLSWKHWVASFLHQSSFS
jgi:spore maturation protein CgeB